VNLFCT